MVRQFKVQIEGLEAQIEELKRDRSAYQAKLLISALNDNNQDNSTKTRYSAVSSGQANFFQSSSTEEQLRLEISDLTN